MKSANRTEPGSVWFWTWKKKQVRMHPEELLLTYQEGIFDGELRVFVCGLLGEWGAHRSCRKAADTGGTERSHIAL